jgi:hypothetical protein
MAEIHATLSLIFASIIVLRDVREMRDCCVDKFSRC